MKTVVVVGQLLRISVTSFLASLVLLSFRFAVGPRRSEFVKFLCVICAIGGITLSFITPHCIAKSH